MTSLIHASHGRKWPGILDVRQLLHSWGAGGRDQAKKQGGFYLEFSVRGTLSLLGELTIRTLYPYLWQLRSRSATFSPSLAAADSFTNRSELLAIPGPQLAFGILKSE